MTRKTRIESELGPLLERLLAERDGPMRDRILLEAVLVLSGAAAVELWWSDGRDWRPRLALGEAHRLPPADRVRARLEGRLAEDVLPLGEQVVLAPRSSWAVALGGLADLHSSDELEGLLLVRAAIGSASDEDGEAPPFPASSSTPSSPSPR